MVSILSRGTSSNMIIMRKELPPGMLLVDVVLRTNLFPLHHRVQRRGAILEALFCISEGYYFGPHHLIMASLLHFEEKMHKRHLTRADTILLLFPRLLCHVLAHVGFPADPHSETRRHCRERASLLTNGIRYCSISIPQNFPRQGMSLHSLYRRQHRLTPHLLFLLPQSSPLLSLLQSIRTCSLLSTL